MNRSSDIGLTWEFHTQCKRSFEVRVQTQLVRSISVVHVTRLPCREGGMDAHSLKSRILHVLICVDIV